MVLPFISFRKLWLKQSQVPFWFSQNLRRAFYNLVVAGPRLLLPFSMLFMFFMVPVVDARPTGRPVPYGVPTYLDFDGPLVAQVVAIWFIRKLCATSVDIASAIGKPLARVATMMLCFMIVLGAMSLFAFNDNEHNVI
jgi:hypothetical protein